MKKVLVLGAGLVAKPMVRYLLEKAGFKVKVATRTVSKAERIIDGHPNGEAVAANVTDADQLRSMIPEADLVVSLVPYTYHVQVAEIAIEFGKHALTTSYVSPEMQELDSAARDANVLVLNELGLDPGIDHMSAMKIIHEVQSQGGKVTGFKSYCGGLPAPDANTNPWGYKFSWSPRGVVMAGKNSARFLDNGQEIAVPGPELFAQVAPVDIPGFGRLESYPNRDSIPYTDLYGIQGTQAMYRATLRYPGWCAPWKMLVDLGFLDEEERNVSGLTYAELLSQFVPGASAATLKQDLARHLGIAENSDAITRYEWLGLLGNDVIPAERSSPLDVLADRLLVMMPYQAGERDMVVLHHDFSIEHPEDGQKKITSTLIDFGIPNGDSSMARTVGLPAAIGVRYILEGKIPLKGIHIPVAPKVYIPILQELERLGIICKEETL
jgi:saccharopine dehydrogenase (NADP+, L-glutamate forming)/spermidine synthase